MQEITLALIIKIYQEASLNKLLLNLAQLSFYLILVLKYIFLGKLCLWGLYQIKYLSHLYQANFILGGD